MLTRVGAGELPETIRLARPEPMVAFGKQDAIAPGYSEAVRAARAGGFEPVLRLAGGRAAVFHEGTIGLAHARAGGAAPGAHPGALRGDGRDRARRAGRGLGVDARVGEVAGRVLPRAPTA